MSRRSFATVLALTPGIGGRTVSRILARNELLGRSPEEFWKLSPESWREEYRLNQRQVANLTRSNGDDRRSLADMEKRLTTLGVQVVTSVDAHYPSLLEEMDPDPPGVLFLYGNTKLLDANTFSVLCSRGSRPSDLDLIEELANEGVLAGEILVTGHDRPEYQRSAVVPLRWGSPRILCLDRGLFQVLGEDLKSEAFRAARLWRYEFDPTTDLVISPFRPEADFIGTNNQLRDRLIGCLSKRIDFVQVQSGGNMQRILTMALKCGRKVRVSDLTLEYRKLAELGAEILSR
ncbi:MAG: DNA-processing protein DprA [Armatimonadetes bacterium]|nr:DNA-processing protein DprA [Armatimonadota bacterium]